MILDNEKLGKEIEVEVLSLFGSDAIQSNNRNCNWDICTNQFLIEVKSTHEKVNNGHKSTRNGRFVITKQSHINLATAAKQQQKTPIYLFVLLNEKNQIKSTIQYLMEDLDKIMKKLKTYKRRMVNNANHFGEIEIFCINQKFIFGGKS